jgi:protein SCO1/2
MKKAGIILALVICAGLALVIASVIPRPRPKATVTDIDPKKLFRPQLGTSIPAHLTFRDQSGKQVTMGDYGKVRPFLLVPVYFKCPSLCNEVLIELVKGLRGVAAYSVGKDYDVVVVSFDPREPPALANAKKQSALEAYDRPESEGGWHFLTGQQDQIDGLLDSIGYKVQWDESKKEYLHASGVVVCSPKGKIVRYFPGLDYRPLYLRLALTEASEGTIRMGVIDQVLLPCFRFDAEKGQYSAAVLTIVKAGGIAMVALIGVFWLGSWLMPRRTPPLSPVLGGEGPGVRGFSVVGQVCNLPASCSAEEAGCKPTPHPHPLSPQGRGENDANGEM